MRKTARLKGTILLLAVLGFVFGLHFIHLYYSRNFHDVVAGEVYRSAQLSGDEIIEVASRHGIKSILNLRGANPGRLWYDQEIAASELAGVQHLDFAMSSTEELNPARAQELIALMRSAPKPLLIHCEAGVNRTGLASALYVAALQNDTLRNAQLQLSLIYGYLPVFFTERYAMMHSFEQLVL